MRNKREDGYFTIEAVFVIPVVFFVLLGIIYFTIYLTEQCKVQAVINQMATQQCLCIKEGNDMGESGNYGAVLGKGIFYYLKEPGDAGTFEQLVKENIEPHLTLGSVQGVTSRISYQEVEIKVIIKVNIGISRVKEFFTGTPLQYQLKTKVPVHNSAEFVRGMTVIGDTFCSIKGMDGIKERIGEIFSVLGGM